MSSPTFTRPKFDSALDTAAHKLPLTSEQREILWTYLRDAMHRRLPRDTTRRPGWTPAAIKLREPLRREIEACRKRHDEGTIINRFEGLGVFLAPPGSTKPPRRFDVVQTFAAYRESMLAIQQRMDTLLRDAGHWYNPPQVMLLAPPREPQPIEVIVANERAHGNPAGTMNWVQWEHQRTRDLIGGVFELANEMARTGKGKGRLWFPYVVPDGWSTERGRADNERRAGLWRKAFYDAIHYPLALLHDRLEQEGEDETSALARCTKLLHAFYDPMRTELGAAAREEAIQRQVRAHRLPTNPRFRPPRFIWHAMDNVARIELAAKYDAVLRACYELCITEGEPVLAADFNPLATPNPWALTEEEHSQLSTV